MRNIFLSILILHFFFYCSEEKKEELKTYLVDEFSIILINEKMYQELIYNGDIPFNVYRKEFSSKFKYLKLKNYPLKFRECRENQCNPEIRGVSPSQFRSFHPEESILLQSKEVSLFIYKKFGYVYFDGKLFNSLGKDKFRVYWKKSYYTDPKVLKELIALVKEKGVEREFMDVLVYSDEKIEHQEVPIFWLGFIFILVAVVGNGIALGLRFLREDNNDKPY